jgi:hypothetical protein
MKVKKEKIFTRGVDCFTQLDLFQKAAALKGLVLKEDSLCISDSQNIKEFLLTEDLLAKLAERGIKKCDNVKEPHFQFILEDEDIRNVGLPEYPTNRWEFRRAIGQKFDLRIFLSVGFERREANDEVIGISLRPQAGGVCFSSASDKRANFHLFKALVEDWPEAPPIAKDLAASDGVIHLSWIDIGWEGLRFRPDLFQYFTGGNDRVFELHEKKIYSPAPFPSESGRGEMLYDTKSVQRYLIRRWNKQLREYRDSLVLKRRKKALV